MKSYNEHVAAHADGVAEILFNEAANSLPGEPVFWSTLDQQQRNQLSVKFLPVGKNILEKMEQIACKYYTSGYYHGLREGRAGTESNPTSQAYVEMRVEGIVQNDLGMGVKLADIQKKVRDVVKSWKGPLSMELISEIMDIVNER